MVASASGFPQFPKLPRELRDQIWQNCLPHRVRELDTPHYLVYYEENESPEIPRPCKLYYTTFCNSRPPLISRVCHESRVVAFKCGKVVADARKRDQDRPPEARWWSMLSVNWTWHDDQRSLVHLNWTHSNAADYQFTPDSEDGNSLRCLAWEASHTIAGGSLLAQYFDDYIGYVNPLHVGPVSRASRTSLYENPPNDMILNTLSSWLVVMKIIVIHSTLQEVAATGLFGLLGDAHVQIVDASEEDRVEDYFALAEGCEHKRPIAARQYFFRETVADMKQQLEDVIDMQLSARDQLMAKMQPAIMFRLCTHMCNHVDRECTDSVRTSRRCECKRCYKRAHLFELAAESGKPVDLDVMEALDRN